MYLYARTGAAAPGKQLEATAFAIDIAAKVNSITSLDVRVWTPVYGAPMNTFSWVAMLEHASDMAMTSEKLLADATYMDAVSGAAELFVSVEDSLGEILSLLGPHEGDPHFASVVTAQCAGGHIAEAVSWGVDLAEHVHTITGRDGAFGRSVYGPWAQVSWISLADTAQQVEIAEAATNADPTFLERVDQAGALFVPSTATSLLSRRIG